MFSRDHPLKPASSNTVSNMSLLLILSVASLLLAISDAKVVVLFSVPHTANVRTHTNVGRALTKMGHKAYVAIPQFMIDEKTVNLEGIEVIAYGDYLEGFEERVFGMNAYKSLEGHGGQSVLSIYYMFRTIQHATYQILTDKQLAKKLKTLKPDLFLLSNFPPFRDIVILPYMFNTPYAYMSPFNDLPSQRVPFSPAATACPVYAGFSNTAPYFTSRIKNTACNAMFILFDVLLGSRIQIAEFAPDRPDISIGELILKAEIFIIESDSILDFAKPELPNMKLVGCTAPTPAKALKEPYKSFVEKSENGVAVVTFGSSIVNIPEPVIKKMESAFLQLKLNVVWRVNYTSQHSNKILTSLWVPQNDILAHRNTKVFVSHCGLNSQYEALYHAVPMLCLPLGADQFFNAQRSTSKGYGLQGILTELTSEDLQKLMNELVNNPKYRNSIEEASSLFRELYKNPIETAAYWIDHVMEHGGSYMRSVGQQMPLYQFLMVDIFAVFFLVLFLVLFIVYWILRCCHCALRRCCSKKPKPRPKPEQRPKRE